MSTQKLIARREAASDVDDDANASATTMNTSAESNVAPMAVAENSDSHPVKIPSPVVDNTCNTVDLAVSSEQSETVVIHELVSKTLGHHEAVQESTTTSTDNDDNHSNTNDVSTEEHTIIDTTAPESSKEADTEVVLGGNRITESKAADSQPIDLSKPSTRSRTRSLSSALSSQSGGGDSSLAGDDSADPIIFDDDGKTPLRTNRMSSRGPVRKRHKNEGPRALFRTNSSDPKSSSQDNRTTSVDSKEEEQPLPPTENDGMSSSIATSLNNTRERSNTIESFRAAMDSHSNNELPTESIVLPDMNESKISADDTKLGETNNNTLPPLPGRDRSDTIDFLTSAVEFQLDGDTSNNLDEIHLSPIGVSKEHEKISTNTAKKVSIHDQALDGSKSGAVGGKSNEAKPQGVKGDAYGKTPKITNRLRATSQSSESTSQGPLRKRYRTRSLSFALLQEEDASLDRTDQRDDGLENYFPAAEGMEDDEILAETGSGYDSFEMFGRRNRSDTIDFLTAAVAGDLGHDLDAAAAAAANDGAAFTTHHVSAPSGASSKYNPLLPKRPRSDTLDSTASSINSAKLDFFVSVAADHGLLLSPVHDGGKAGSMASDHSSEYSHSRRPRSNTLEIYSNMASARARSNTVEFLMGSDVPPEGSIDDLVIHPDSIEEHATTGNVLDHLKALCDDPKGSDTKSSKVLRFKRHSSSDMMDGIASLKTKSDEGSSAGKKFRKSPESSRRTSISQDSLLNSTSRNRLESWGGMSDLSTGAMSSSAIAATHTALKDTGILDDVLAAAADLGFDDLSEGVASFERMRDNRSASIGSNSLSIQKGRQRLDSLASLSLASLSDASSAKPTHKSDAKNVTKQSAKCPTGDRQRRIAKPSDVSSVGANSIVVDYDAIASAVHAATAATDGLDLTAILGKPSSSKLSSSMVNPTSELKGIKNKEKAGVSRPSKLATPLPKAPMTKETSTSTKNASRFQHKSQPRPSLPMTRAYPKLLAASPEPAISGSLLGLNTKPPTSFPVSTINIPLVPIPTCTKTKEEMEARQERARAAAGYVPPGAQGKITVDVPPARPVHITSSNSMPLHPGVPTRIPIKKRAPHPPFLPMPDRIHSQDFLTPHSQIKSDPVTSSDPTSKAGTLQSQQKWDDMFECLVKFIEDTREKSTKNMTDEQKAAWVWDGNVQTSYKAPCGKALGRWINNQRSAKAKGTLKDDREVRLVSTGLKWSVLTTNSWRQMLRELEIYVNEQTKDGGTWDGNVPTNYRIKSSIPIYNTDDDEKNLGRWVNRQRSLFQAGKLKKDRQLDLEKIGLKWSVLLTTSWTSMFESLCAYADEKRKQSPNGWDGNVPANFKTRSNPSLSLGRWVNRQRSAHAKGRLKDEYVKQLEAIGLKWVIHNRNRTNDEEDGAEDDDDDDDDDDFIGGEFIESDVAKANNDNNAALHGNLVSGNGTSAPGSQTNDNNAALHGKLVSGNGSAEKGSQLLS